MKQFQGLFLILVGIVSTLVIGSTIGIGNDFYLITFTSGLAFGLVAFMLAGDWRRGIYLFLIWLIFEDLIRKYLGNNMIVYLAKDGLVVLIYAIFLFKWKQGEVKFFYPPFLFPMLLVIWLGIMHVFNPNSPSIFYGIVGFKLYFFYIPLMFLSYALIDSERTLQIFLVFNLALASIAATVGIIQSIVGPGFLNPQTLAPELEQLNLLFRSAPEGAAFYRPPGIFLSDGRFGWYLMLMFVISFGTIIYFSSIGKSWGFKLVPISTLALCFMALVMSGARGSFLLSLISLLVLFSSTVWYNFQRRRSSRNLVQATMPIFGMVVLGPLLMLLLYPAEIEARWQFYVQTLVPGSEYSTIGYRAWEFPLSQFMVNVTAPLAPIGYGIGTASQALVYVPEFFGAPLPQTVRAGESGFGVIAAELGYLGLLLWIVWVGAILYSGWQLLYQLRKTALFPIGFALFWVAFLVLVILTSGGIMAYQNFVNNMYLWIFLGMLFKLPTLVTKETADSNEGFWSAPR
jgi:hypothetical protein